MQVQGKIPEDANTDVPRNLRSDRPAQFNKRPKVSPPPTFKLPYYHLKLAKNTFISSEKSLLLYILHRHAKVIFSSHFFFFLLVPKIATFSFWFNYNSETIG